MCSHLILLYNQKHIADSSNFIEQTMSYEIYFNVIHLSRLRQKIYKYLMTIQ